MADDAAIRRTNLKRWANARHWSAVEISQHLYGTYSYWRDMLNTTDKSFGERAARKFEEAAQLPRLWLDQIDADMALATPATTAREPRPSMPPAGWPWSAELWAAVLRLDEDQAAHAEAVLRAHLGLGG